MQYENIDSAEDCRDGIVTGRDEHIEKSPGGY
jgi:hypothetical protein